MYKLQKYRNISFSLFVLSLILLCVSAFRGGGIDAILELIEYSDNRANYNAFDVLAALRTLIFFSMSLIWGFLSFVLRQLVKELWSV